MTLILLRIGSAALLSLLSLLVILFRVSPFTSPAIALPLFFFTLFLSVASIGSLIAYIVWHRLFVEGMDEGRKLSVALREGFFLGTATTLCFLLQILDVFTWWIGVLLFVIVALVEVALHS